MVEFITYWPVVSRLAHQEAVDRCQAAQLAAEAAAVEKVRLNKDLGDAQRMLVALLQSSAEDSRAEMLGLCNELKVRGSSSPQFANLSRRTA